MTKGKIAASELPLIVVVGPTASGKTNLAIQLAMKFNGEIVCADSRTVYRGMDIGTAKPTSGERASVPHHLLDLVNPNERFTLWNFQHLAKEKIEEIRSRGKIPFMVGGSGLYIDSVIFNYELGSEADMDLRDKLDKMTVNDLLSMLKLHHIEIPNNSKNKRYLIRAIEQNGINSKRQNRPENVYVVGISTDKAILEERIRDRSEIMLNDGFVDEVKKLVHDYGANCEPFNNNSYGVIKKFISGEIKTREELLDRMVIIDRQLAKKQMTWFKRNDCIQWMSSMDAYKYVSKLLD
jgi:tRNA dimethylallyltransferase